MQAPVSSCHACRRCMPATWQSQKPPVRVSNQRYSVTVASSTPMSKDRLQRLFHGVKPAQLLERSLSARAGVDADLWREIEFAGQVVPDLPVASDWNGLLKALLRRFSASPHAPAGRPVDMAAGEGPQDQQPLLIRTVAAQIRSRRAIKERMIRLTDATCATVEEPAADALLCISGSHPARMLPGSGRWFSDSFQTLRTATEMRLQGQLPQHVSLWGVENPLTNLPSRFEAKVEAGAEVIVTQPPLVWGKFEAWFEEVHRQGWTRDARLVVGLPMLTSAGNLAFWAALCDAQNVDGMDAVMQQFRAAEAAGKPQLRKFCSSWNADLLQKVKALPGVDGLHVMPLTKTARSLARDLLC